MAGLLGGLFDFNHDGKLDSFEKATEFATFASMMDTMESEKESIEFNTDDELEMLGLDRDELEGMDEGERREVMEAVGLDSDDWEL